MAILTVPSSPGFRSTRFGLERDDYSLALKSGATIEAVSPSNRYYGSFFLPDVKAAQLRLWRSFLSQATSADNQFLVSPPDHVGPSTGYAGSNPLIDGAGQLGLSISVDGLPASTAILLEGDYLSVDNRLYECTSDVTSDGSGGAVISLNRPLRDAPQDNAVVELLAPVSIMKLPNRSYLVDENRNRTYRVSFDAVEYVSP